MKSAGAPTCRVFRNEDVFETFRNTGDWNARAAISAAATADWGSSLQGDPAPDP
jgi:hypothetical protein